MTGPNRADLPHLLALLDDESRLVRDSVLAKFAEFGSELDLELQLVSEPPGAARLAQLHAWLDDYRGRLAAFREGGPTGVVIGSALFQPGDLVRHRRYGYRGLVVERDLSCQADLAWYRGNHTQPERAQPWYHVLVDQSEAVTYAAQTSLQADEIGGTIDHPMAVHFFECGPDGVYRRNGLAWPRE